MAERTSNNNPSNNTVRNTSEEIEKLAEQIEALDQLTQGKTKKECDDDPVINAAKKNFTNDIRSFLKEYVGASDSSPSAARTGKNAKRTANQRKWPEPERTEEQATALKASHQLFELHCETVLFAQSVMDDAEAYINDGIYADEFEAEEAAEDDFDYAEKVLILARRLWLMSVIGIEE